MMRQRLVQIHLYAGLICSSTLLLLGINSLMRNHPMPSIHETKSTVQWQEVVDSNLVYSETMAAKHSELKQTWAKIRQMREQGATRESLKPHQDAAGQLKQELYNQAALQIRDELNLIGWVPGWEIRRQDNGDLHFSVVRPGKKQILTVAAESGAVAVKEERKGGWVVVRALHGLMKIPNSRLMTVWGWYTEISIWAFLVMAVTSIFIWTYRKKNRRLGILMLVGGFTISMSMILYIWLVG